MTNTRTQFFKSLPAWWPVVVAVASCIAMGSSIATQASTTKERLDKLEQLAPALDGRLVRIETEVRDLSKTEDTNHADVSATLDRLDDKLDHLSEKSRPR